MQIIRFKDIIKEELRSNSLDLMTRQTGQRIFQHLENKIKQAKEGETVSLDFWGVGVIDYSCADEVIAKIVLRMIQNEYGDRYLILQNLTPTQKENISVALERKNLAIIGLKSKDKSWEIMGTIDDYLLETLEIIMKNGSMSSSILRKKLKLELNTASMRLINLHKLRLVKKIKASSSKKGKRHFVYKSLLV